MQRASSWRGGSGMRWRRDCMTMRAVYTPRQCRRRRTAWRSTMSTDTLIAINEIFSSLQGEGSCLGQPQTFIRVSGCNLACVWCDQPDTIHEGYVDRQGKTWLLVFTKMSVADIISTARKWPTRTVCLTGGEPSAHKLGELVGRLHVAGFAVHMESNGTRQPDWLEHVDHLVVSPKREAQIGRA